VHEEPLDPRGALSFVASQDVVLAGRRLDVAVLPQSPFEQRNMARCDVLDMMERIWTRLASGNPLIALQNPFFRYGKHHLSLSKLVRNEKNRYESIFSLRKTTFSLHKGPNRYERDFHNAMPKVIPEEELQKVETAIRAVPNGALMA